MKNLFWIDCKDKNICKANAQKYRIVEAMILTARFQDSGTGIQRRSSQDIEVVEPWILKKSFLGDKNNGNQQRISYGSCERV